nr:putative ribonuclease H-like domain-containing protein [Tanacetum cinerariifolium]
MTVMDQTSEAVVTTTTATTTTLATTTGVPVMGVTRETEVSSPTDLSILVSTSPGVPLRATPTQSALRVDADTQESIVELLSPVIIIRTDNGIEFKNQVLKEYFDSVGISHQVSSVRTPQQNRVLEVRNRTLVEAARTILIFSRAPLFLWAKAIATACFTQNRSIIH